MKVEVDKNILSRFFEKTRAVDGCLIWTANKDKDGYGIFYFFKKNRRAHRVSYYIHFGDIKKGYVIHHICGNTSCVAPAHLQMVSPRINCLISNSPASKNAKKVGCKNGHPFDKKYGKQRYCSICEKAKQKRLYQKNKHLANQIYC